MAGAGAAAVGGGAGLLEDLMRTVVAGTAMAGDAGFVLQHVEAGDAFAHGVLDIAVGNAAANADDHGGTTWISATSLQANTNSSQSSPQNTGVLSVRCVTPPPTAFSCPRPSDSAGSSARRPGRPGR